MASSSAEIAAEVDKLHYSGNWQDAYEYLKPHSDGSTDPEVLWRLLRSYYRVGKYLTKDKQKVEYLAQKGHDIMERALKLHENDFNVQKWSGIFLSWQSEVGGTKSKIEKSFDVKAHFEKAIAIDGSDPEVKHTLGRWCFEVASVGWMTRQIAQAIFASPPKSSFDEALKYFLDAEETKPGFYVANWLYLGKTYYQLSKYKEAKPWLLKLLEIECKNVEEEQLQEEGKILLKKI